MQYASFVSQELDAASQLFTFTVGNVSCACIKPFFPRVVTQQFVEVEIFEISGTRVSQCRAV